MRKRYLSHPKQAIRSNEAWVTVFEEKNKQYAKIIIDTVGQYNASYNELIYTDNDTNNHGVTSQTAHLLSLLQYHSFSVSSNSCKFASHIFQISNYTWFFISIYLKFE